jgi:glyoxylase-like metal-dependent hydrolase (beta-lactamase superfamily II)
VPEYQVYALRYASMPDRTSKGNFIGGDSPDIPMPLDYYVWAIVGDGRTIIVDTGFDKATGDQHQAKLTHAVNLVTPVREALSRIAIRSEHVQDVIITHMHWDHAGNHDLFPNARYHVQEREMHYCTGSCMCFPLLRKPFEEADVQAMIKKLYAGRVALHPMDAELFPGVSVHWVGGHTDGLQVVRVTTTRGPVVLASDASHFYANFMERRAYPVVHNIGDMLKGFGRLVSLAGDSARVVPGHDPKVLQIYPAAHAEADGIVRLDLEPRSLI